MDRVFKQWIRQNVKVYMDNMIVKSQRIPQHVGDLEEVFGELRKYDMHFCEWFDYLRIHILLHFFLPSIFLFLSCSNDLHLCFCEWFEPAKLVLKPFHHSLSP